MPRIVRFHEVGGPEKLQLEDAPEQQPGPNEVRLRVLATGLNRAEALYMRGHYFEQPKLPSRIGYEAAGVVEAVGPGVDQSWIGKTVSTVPGFSMNQYGVLGEQAVVPASALGEYPAKLSPEEGAAIWMQYMTAWGALVHYGHVAACDAVLIPAASSSVGLAAIQIVKDAGATAIAATRTGKKREELQSLGADHVIATEEEDLPARVQQITAGKGARLIFDRSPAPTLKSSRKLPLPALLFSNMVASPCSPRPSPCSPPCARASASAAIRSWSSATILPCSMPAKSTSTNALLMAAFTRRSRRSSRWTKPPTLTAISSRMLRSAKL